MKKRLLLHVGVLLVTLVLCGCSSVSWENVGYTSPANEVNLKSNPSIKVVAFGSSPILSPLVKSINQELVRSGQLKTGTGQPDYWIAIYGEKDFRTDDAAAKPFNRKVEMVQKRTGGGGQDVLQTVDHNTSAAAEFLNVVIYGVSNLSPVYYFDIVLYDSDFKSGAVRGEADYNREFSKQIIAKFRDAFLVQKRVVETAFPDNGDSKMKKALVAGDTKAALARAKELVPQEFDAFVADVSAGKYKDKADEMETRLSNYYLLALANEIGNLEPGNLQKLHAQHVTILKLTTEDGLSTAVPNSLARIEHKLKLLRALDN